jgi:hypothetical protein
MNKILNRKGTTAMGLFGVILIACSLNLFWQGFTHVGKGYWTFGGDSESDGTDGDIYTAEVSQSQYRRECLSGAVSLLVLGGLFLGAAVQLWTKQDHIDKVWKLPPSPLN